MPDYTHTPLPIPALLQQPAQKVPETAFLTADSLGRIDLYAPITPLTNYREAADISLPFFTLQQVELPEGYGVTGQPLAYNFRTDDWISGTILLCLVLVAWAITRSRNYVGSTIKPFFRDRPISASGTEHNNTAFHGLTLLVLQTCFCLSILYYNYMHEAKHGTFQPETPYLALGITACSLLIYVLLKLATYSVVNAIFYDRRQCEEWNGAYLLSVAGTGLLLLPVTLLVIYLNLSFDLQKILFLGILASGKLLLFYRAYRTFFRHFGGWLHLILYFCTLEIVPTLLMWRVLYWANITLTAAI